MSEKLIYLFQVLDGGLQEVRYEWPQNEEEPMTEKSRGCLKNNEVCYINGKNSLVFLVL